MKRISIYHKDREYLLAASRRLAQLLKGVDVFPADGPEEGGEVYIMDGFMPVSKAAGEISDMLGIHVKTDMRSSMTGFVSGAGGCGTSTAALMYAGHLSDFLGLKTVYISLDPLCCKACASEGPARSLLYSVLFEGGMEDMHSLFVRDSRGVFRMTGEGRENPLGLLSSRDLIRFLEAAGEEFAITVLDIPLASPFAQELLEVCDNLAVCFGWQEERYAPSEAVFGMLSARRDGVYRFFSSFDEAFSDPYGQLGAEVRELAQLIGRS